ncbi:hypothetical protein CEJ45_20745 [Herbaspirillum aquaticum]|uniref:ATPase dynein-related AAA domain-containing protein n=1 Tax=Herbaspirillum aquaticum TaxID=568783 RepID=A0A225SPH5_9BURK|nr:hypothetical protein CEJ45_20745 [Herbaspirillum aquaticum]
MGDVLQLLDRDQVTGASQYEIDITPEQKSYFSSLGVSVNSLRLPSNLFIWATMNNADQGVFPLDTAFRRRWNYVYKGYTEVCGYPAENCRIEYGGLYYNWDQFRGVLNNHLVEQGIHEDKLIGPYFLTEQQLANSEAVLQKLFLYLWDDVLRFRQETLFLAKSFSGVSRDWKDGKGSPLTGLFNSALSKAIQEQSDAEDPILAPEET